MHFTATDDDGRRYRERTIGGRTYRYYADEGRALGSVWTDCPAMIANTPLRRETTGYPTQKPLKLLERIVRASSREGGARRRPVLRLGHDARRGGAASGGASPAATSGSSRSRRRSERLRGEGAAFELRVDSTGCTADGEASLLPLFLKLAGKPVLVVGAGAVAERKIESLLEAGARVRVVAPEATEGVQRLAREGRVAWERARLRGRRRGRACGSSSRRRRTPRCSGAWPRRRHARRVFCVAVDDPPNASAYSGAVVRRPPFTVAISSGGATPALTRLLREVLEHVLPGDDWVEHAKRLRASGAPRARRWAIASRSS